MNKKYNIGDRPVYGSIAYDIKCNKEDYGNHKNLALSMMVKAKSYASTYGIIFEDGSELYFYKSSLSVEETKLIKNKMG